MGALHASPWCSTARRCSPAAAGSGESEIRRWIIENDWLEAIIGLPDQLFYNTGISTYLWIITNRKSAQRKGKVQLIDATAMSEKMRRSLGNKRNQITEAQIADITRLFGEVAEGENSKVFDNEDFGYWRITVERPLRLNFAIHAGADRGGRAAGRVRRSGQKPEKGTRGRGGNRRWAEAPKTRSWACSSPSHSSGGSGRTREAFAAKLKTAFKRNDVKVPHAGDEGGAVGTVRAGRDGGCVRREPTNPNVMPICATPRMFR